ncbi:hypothetical protein GCM10023191_012200 [Actinoallomurus oryzae]|uniref:Uncharacterized protein n=1 Tax=Actinoallomurus oryzae TaxID=502180 RepID=A0ABP8PEX6_9ACTN
MLVSLAVVVPLLGCALGFGTAHAGAREDPDGPVVVVGVPGLRWDDLDPRDAPNLWRLAGRAGLANLSTYTVSGVTCPVDGWLTVSAGQRASLYGGERAVCDLPAPPSPSGSGAIVPGFAQIRARNLHGKYAARVGSLGTAIHRSGGLTMAAGPGAAFAAADDQGRVDFYSPAPEAVPPARWASVRLAVVDVDDVQRAYPRAGSATISRTRRAAAVRQADRRIGGVLTALPASAKVVVAGVSDTTRRNSLHVLMTAPGLRPRYLTSASTRRQGLVTLTDLTAGALSAAGVPAPAAVVGRAWHPEGEPVTVAAAADSFGDANRAAEISQHTMTPFWIAFMAGQLLLYAAGALALRRNWQGGRRRRILAATRTVALCGAAGPLATYLVNLLPWSRSPHPVTTMFACVAGFDILLVTAALAGRWRRDVIAPGTIIAALTMVTFATDVMTGARLQWDSVTGYNPIIAGRFYGFANIAFAAYATAVLLTAAGLAHLLVTRGHRRGAVIVVLVLGAAAEVVTAWPDWGAKFGGTIAFVPGIVLTALIVAGRRISPAHVVGCLAAGVVVIATSAFIDYSRPPADRTHLGEFAGQVLNGQAATVMTRKAGAMLRSVGHSPELTVLTVAALLFLWLALIRPTRWRAGALELAYGRAPALRAGLGGAFATSMIGFLVEDSGISVPGIALAIAVPLALAAATRTLAIHRRAAGASLAEDGDG